MPTVKVTLDIEDDAGEHQVEIEAIVEEADEESGHNGSISSWKVTDVSAGGPSVDEAKEIIQDDYEDTLEEKVWERYDEGDYTP